MKAKAPDNRFFCEDTDFRVCFRPDKISYVDDPARVTRALHEEIEIKYFYEGSSTLLIGKETIEVQKGDLVVINPYEPHSTIRFGEERGHYRFLMMDLDFFMDGTTGGLDLRTLMIERGLTFKPLIRGDARLADIMRRMTEANKSKSEYRRFAMRATMLELFSLLLAEYATRPSRERNGSFRALETVEPALRRIREGYAAPITLDELAALCNISKCHFCRMFRKVTGQSAMRYLTEYRLKIADLMLSGSGDSIGTIAEQCGFPEQTYFCQCYKAHFGISPSARRAKKP